MEDQNRQEPIQNALESMEYDFAGEEAYFLKSEDRQNRLDAYEKELSWLEHELFSKADQSKCQKISAKIDEIRALHHLTKERGKRLFTHEEKKQFASDKRDAYKSAQAINLSIAVVRRTIEKLHKRPEDLQIISDISRRFLDSKEAGEMIVTEIMRIRGRLHFRQRISGTKVREEAKIRIGKKLLG